MTIVCICWVKSQKLNYNARNGKHKIYPDRLPKNISQYSLDPKLEPGTFQLGIKRKTETQKVLKWRLNTRGEKK
jgi:hypothetical protein